MSAENCKDRFVISRYKTPGKTGVLLIFEIVSPNIPFLQIFPKKIADWTDTVWMQSVRNKLAYSFLLSLMSNIYPTEMIRPQMSLDTDKYPDNLIDSGSDGYNYDLGNKSQRVKPKMPSCVFELFEIYKGLTVLQSKSTAISQTNINYCITFQSKENIIGKKGWHQIIFKLVIK